MELLRKLEQKENFTERECEIADYILRNCESVLKMTTRELASETFTSATVIVRFVKKSAMMDFRISNFTCWSISRRASLNEWRSNERNTFFR